MFTIRSSDEANFEAMKAFHFDTREHTIDEYEQFVEAAETCFANVPVLE